MSNGIGIREMAKHNNNCYCMASSASGQDGPNRLLWLATQPGKMSPIARFDWLPERARWTQSLALIGYPSEQDEPNRALWLATRAGKMELPCTFIDQACSVKMTGYWPRSLFYEFMDLESVSVHNTRKKNLANIQSSWPQACRSITHLYRWWNSQASGGAEVQVTGCTGRRSQIIDQG